jgi:hypothetical protein
VLRFEFGNQTRIHDEIDCGTKNRTGGLCQNVRNDLGPTERLAATEQSKGNGYGRIQMRSRYTGGTANGERDGNDPDGSNLKEARDGAGKYLRHDHARSQLDNDKGAEDSAKFAGETCSISFVSSDISVCARLNETLIGPQDLAGVVRKGGVVGASDDCCCCLVKFFRICEDVLRIIADLAFTGVRCGYCYCCYCGSLDFFEREAIERVGEDPKREKAVR